jgi:hypothetical protein
LETVGKMVVTKSGELYVGDRDSVVQYDFQDWKNKKRSFDIQRLEDTRWFPSILVLNSDQTMLLTADPGNRYECIAY